METIRPYHYMGNYPEDYLPLKKYHPFQGPTHYQFINAPPFEKFRQNMLSTRNRTLNQFKNSYQLPAQYLVLGILMIYIGRSILSLTGVGKIILILGYFLLFLEILGPILLRLSFYDNFIHNVSRLHAKFFRRSRLLRKFEKVKYWRD